MSVELPLKNTNAREQESEEKVRQQELDFKRASAAVEESMKTTTLGDKMAGEMMKHAQGDESAADVLDKEKTNSLVRVILRLQSEGQHVLKSKYDLFALTVPTEDQSVEEKIEAKKERIAEIIHYLQANPNTLQAPESDPRAALAKIDNLSNLLSLGQGEVTHAIDSLITDLEQKEELIEQRLAKMVHHLGEKERVLIEQKNFDYEMEDVPTPTPMEYTDGRANHKVEEVLSLNEQLYNITRHKEMTSAEKMKWLLV